MGKTDEKQTKGGKFKPGNKVGKQFKPGVSGNPKGRPRTDALTVALREELAKENIPGQTIAQQIAKALVDKAVAGDIKAVALVFDRAEGKAPIRFDGGEEGDLLITFNFNSNARLK